MSTRKLHAITLAGAFALVVSFQSQATEPVRLSESQLDEVTAGFLAVSMAAEASALSRVADALTDTVTLTNVTVGQPQADGYIYSNGEGLAIATAIGEQVYTSTSGGFDTDEQVVSFKILHSITTETVKQAAPEPATKQRPARKEQQATKRQTRQEKRQAAKRQTRQEKRQAAKRQTRQEKRQAAKRQGKREARARAKSADPVFKQTQVLQLQVVTRRPATDLPF